MTLDLTNIAQVMEIAQWCFIGGVALFIYFYFC